MADNRDFINTKNGGKTIMADNKNIELNDEAMVKAAGGSGRSDDYDMYGFVVDKLPTDRLM